MIITQTPLRVGLVGGGTDLPGYYREHGGRVLNAAIDKYVYVIVKQRFDDDIYVNYSPKEIVSPGRGPPARAGPRGHAHGRGPRRRRDHDARRHPVGGLRPGLLLVGDRRAPARALRLPGRQLTAEELAERACTIEIDRCRKPIGKQDQYAAAYGGICDLRFGPGDRVAVDQIRLAPTLRRHVQDELLLFFTGITRSADTILGEQTANIADRCPSSTSSATSPARRRTVCARATSTPSASR